jgi:hypothetical protein
MAFFICAIIMRCQSKVSLGTHRLSDGAEKTERVGQLAREDSAEGVSELHPCVHRCLICGREIPTHELHQPDRASWSPEGGGGGTAIGGRLPMDDEQSRMEYLSLHITFLLLAAIRFRIVSRRMHNSLPRVEIVLEDGLETPRM